MTHDFACSYWPDNWPSRRVKEKSLKREVGEYIYQNYVAMQSWSAKNLMRWIQWAIAQQRIVVIRDGANIAGITVYRTLRPTTETQIYGLEQDADGEIIYIDLTISTKGKSVLKTALAEILRRLGPKPLIAFNQYKYQDRLRVYRMSKFKEIVYGRRK